MRGKKDPTGPDPVDNLVDYEYEKRSPMGFQGMRGKKDENYSPDDDFGGFVQEYYDKRAPMGFQGMRGKKEMPFEEVYFKRAMMGFQGMRGKKSLEEVGKFFF